MYKTIIFVIFIVMIVSNVFAGDSPDYRTEKAEVLAFMEKFCKEEFNSDFEEYIGDKVAFSRERARKENKRAYQGKMFHIASDPFVIVDSYEISGVYIKSKKSATVIVKYNELSYCSRNYPPEERSCLDHQIKDEKVPYRLIKVKSHWKVLDPPFPRISLDTVIKHYSWFVKENNRIRDISSHLPARTRDIHKREEEDLIFFLKLRKKYPRLTGDKKPSSSNLQEK